MITAEEFVEQFDRSFTSMKADIYQSIEKQYPMIAREEGMSGAFVKSGSISGLGMPVKANDGQEVKLDAPVKGLTASFFPNTFKLGYTIERATVEDGVTGHLANRPVTMIQGSVLIRDLAVADIFNNGTTSQPYDIGGKPLFATDHVREDNAATWSNRLTTQLPITVETVFQVIMDYLYNLRDERGNIIAYNGKINICVPAINSTLVKSALEVVKSMMNPGTSDNAVNVLTQMFSLDVVVMRYATDPNAWFVGWTPSAQGYGVVLYNRTEPEISPLEPYKGNRDVWFSRMRMRFAAGIDAKRGIMRVG